MTRLRLYASETRPGGLPPVCLVCGRPATAHVSKTFIWRPPALGIGFWAAVCVCLPLAIVLGVLLTRRKTIESPLCDRHRDYWAWRTFWLTVPLLVLAAGTIGLAVMALTEKLPENTFGLLCTGTGVLLLVWAVTASLLHRTGIRVVELTDDAITLEPVSPTFAAAVRAERHAPPRDPADGYDPYPTGTPAAPE